MRRAPWPVLLLILLMLSAALLRIPAALRPGIWADEIFSLAMATGHSLEHPAAAADSALGDFVEPREAQPPLVFRRYTEHEDPPAGLGRVIRAVLLSDTSPPLYYLLLYQWTRRFGTGDAALPLFSVWWAVLSVPLIWLVGRHVGGVRVAWSACVLFTLSPVAIYYSDEGRMYSLLWFLALLLAWLTLQLVDDRRTWPAVLWVLSGAAGFLTHYFFAFVWLACLIWLWFSRPAVLRWRVAGLAGATLLLVLPWYVEVPASLARWRVTGGWLTGELTWPHAFGQPFLLGASLLSGNTDLGSRRWADRFAVGLFVFLALWMVHRGLVRRIFFQRALLLWGWLAAACVGPLVFDLLRHTTTSEIPRYVLPGLPAAMLLAALGMSQLPLKLHLPFLSLLLLTWLPGTRKTILPHTPRPRQPYPELDARLESWAVPGDVVVVRSIPSGVIGVARYLDGDIPLAAWITQLGSREVPGDLEWLLRGRHRVALVRIHNLGAEDALEPWLRNHARQFGHEVFRSSSAEVLYFRPARGSAFSDSVPWSR